jgi:pilus assembly protein CpaB
MMRRRWSPASKVLVVLALASGLATFALVRGYAARLEALRPIVGAPEPVVVAARNLTRGTRLSDSMVRVVEIPGTYAPPGALNSVEQASGRTLLSDLARDEPLTQTRLGIGSAGRVASLVPSGFRAFTVSAAIPAGAVRPGDRVDVLATFGGGQPHTETVATGLEVLLVLDSGEGAITTAGGLDPSGTSLVLLVSPDQAERLAYATAFGDVAVSIDSLEEVVAG